MFVLYSLTSSRRIQHCIFPPKMCFYSDERHSCLVNVWALLHLGELRDDQDLERASIDISDQVMVGDESAILAHAEERGGQQEFKKLGANSNPRALTVLL